ncbi:HesA/MoeB/ThiF family protein [Rossellomorea sp. NPDC077527]|uniref:HesA/MoeB/ThiF family protein n=1 Tax=Rossellomorea sp. NPDC077527 TaxID=3364510 RepID=UPI0037C90986
MNRVKLKKTLQPLEKNNRIFFGAGQPGLERTIESNEENKIFLKYINGEIDRSSLDLSESTVDEKMSFFEKEGLLTTNDYQKDYRYSRNVNFFEWVDTTSNTNPYKYQDKLSKARVLVVGLGGIGANVCEILVRMGVSNLIILDNDTIDESNLTRQGTYFEDDIGKLKVDVAEQYLKKINAEVNIKKVKTFINSKEDLKSLFEEFQFDLSICCADKPKIIIDSWFDELSIEYDRPYVAGSYASTVINTFCMYPNRTITSAELYGERGASQEQLLEDISFPTSVVGPVTFMAAGLVAYQVQSVITGLNYKEQAVQIDIFDWNVYKYDIRKK